MKNVKVIRLGSKGHTECIVRESDARMMVANDLAAGFFAYCEPDQIVITDKKDLEGRHLEKVVLYAPVAGG